MVRDVVREIAGFAPYERKIMALIRDGVAWKDKKARKLARKRLGTMRRAKIKITELETVVQEQKKEAQRAKEAADAAKAAAEEAKK